MLGWINKIKNAPILGIYIMVYGGNFFSIVEATMCF